MDQTRREVAHLLRRAGFGASPAEIDAAARAGYDATVQRLLHTAASDDDEARVADLDVDRARVDGVRLVWLHRMLRTQQPLREKMVLFWHGHLTSAVSKLGGRRGPALMDEQLTLFREQALGNWRELLRAISRNPAMLGYLDNRLNRKGAPNENYARELMELFTLGIGNYDEQDIKEAARAFTGWTVDREGNFTINQAQHDNGMKTVLGRTGPWTGDDVIDILLEHPAAGSYLARKLFRYFAYDEPEFAVVERLAAEFRRSSYDLRTLVSAILRSPEFRSERAYHATIKSPVELAIGTLRLLGVDSAPRDLPVLLRRMGQDLLNPPSVKGWDGGASWINATTMVERFNFANRLAAARGDGGEGYLDPQALASRFKSADALVDYFGELFLDGELPATSRVVLLDYARDAGDGFAAADMADQKVRGLAHLVMASPLYQLN